MADIPQVAKKAEATVEGEGKGKEKTYLTEEDLERERQELVAETGGKQKTLLAVLPTGDAAALRAGLKKTRAKPIEEIEAEKQQKHEEELAAAVRQRSNSFKVAFWR